MQVERDKARLASKGLTLRQKDLIHAARHEAASPLHAYDRKKTKYNTAGQVALRRLAVRSATALLELVPLPERAWASPDSAAPAAA